MIAEKAADMIKEDWMQSIDIIPCERKYKQNEGTTEDDLPNRIRFSQLGTPDILNETSSLFPQLSKGFLPTNKQRSNTSLLTLNNARKETSLPNSYNSINRYHNSDVTNTYDQINPKILQSYSSNIPQYAFKPNPFGNTNILKHPVLSPINPFTDLTERDKIRPYYARRHFKQRNYRPRDQKSFYNVFKPQNVQQGSNENKKKIYFKTEEVISPKGRKECKIWLYYDGMKYKVTI